MPSTATYLYCLVHSASVPSLARVPAGLPGATHPSLVPVARSLRAVVAQVPLEVYGSPALDAALGDMQWVGEVALAHESVVEHFARGKGATVIPMKLFTMFSTVERAVQNVKAQEKPIAAALKRVRSCAEWGVRVTKTPARARAASGTRANSGAAFLAAKKQARDDARAALLASAEAADEAFHLLASAARATRRREGEPQGAASPPLLDAAFLVPSTSIARFKAAARRAAARCADAGAELTLTGPWPAYNFVQLGERR